MHDTGTKRGFWKETITTFLLVVVALVIISFATQLTLKQDSKLSRIEVAAERERLSSREIIEFEAEGEGSSAVVRYSYVGEGVPEKLTEDEVVSRRTSQSYTRDLGVDPDDTSKHKYVTVAYARPAFIERNGWWHYVEYATAPKYIFDSATRKEAFLLRLIPKVLADTVTIYSGSGDGYLDAISATWAASRDASTATEGDVAGEAAYVGSAFASGKLGSTYTVYRTFLPFDTSSIPSGAIVTAATLNVYATSSTLGQLVGAMDYVTVVETTQIDHAGLDADDFDQVGSTEGIDSGQRKNIKPMSNGALQSFTLNQTGQDWIKSAGKPSSCSSTNGITCIGLRSGFDVNNTAATSTANFIGFITSEQAGTSLDPNLAVTYRAGFAFWQFDLF